MVVLSNTFKEKCWLAPKNATHFGEAVWLRSHLSLAIMEAVIQGHLCSTNNGIADIVRCLED